MSLNIACIAFRRITWSSWKGELPVSSLIIHDSRVSHNITCSPMFLSRSSRPTLSVAFRPAESIHSRTKCYSASERHSHLLAARLVQSAVSNKRYFLPSDWVLLSVFWDEGMREPAIVWNDVVIRERTLHELCNQEKEQSPLILGTVQWGNVESSHGSPTPPFWVCFTWLPSIYRRVLLGP